MKLVRSHIETQRQAHLSRLFAELRADSWPLSASMNDGGYREDSIG